MELMSSLLLYAFAVLIPQALGNINTPSFHTVHNVSTIIENSELFEINNVTKSNEILNSKSQSNQMDFIEDPICKSCYSCMEHALQSYIVTTKINKEHYERAIVGKDNKIRIKRNPSQASSDNKAKKSKNKKTKTVTIIKYNDNAKTYALKVKETQNSVKNMNNSTTTCLVYSIQKHFPCESPGANLILKASKRKTNKNNKKKRSKRQKNVTDTKTTVIASAFRKRHIDSSQLPEQIMSSIEEMY